MSKRIFIIFLLAGLLAFSSAIVCTPNFCKVFKCLEVTEEICNKQNAIFVPRSSLCGCCPTCVKLPDQRVTPDVPLKLCAFPFIGSNEPGFYLC